MLYKSQVEKLGTRLVAEPRVRPEDLEALHALLAEYGEVLGRTADRVRAELGVAPTSRVKNTGTILEKLRRFGGSWLKSIDDLAGMRIVGDFDRHGQDELVARIVEFFAGEKRPPKIVDRRTEPAQGYRAVHVIVFPNGVPVEIQVRTRLQHEWAELFEKIADLMGRGIRYGDAPRGRLSSALGEPKLAAFVARIERRLVKDALDLAQVIDQFEVAERERPGAPELVAIREINYRTLSHLRLAVQAYERAVPEA